MLKDIPIGRLVLLAVLVGTVVPYHLSPASAQQNTGPRETVTLDGPWELIGPSRATAVLDNPDGPMRTYSISALATVPAALTASGVLPEDPYFDDTPADIAWVGREPWEYVHTFDAPAKWAGRHVRLVVEGATYRAQVTLNNKDVGETVGMFDRGVWDVTPLVQTDARNRLQIRTEPASDPTAAVVSQMAYGWDFAPQIPPVGLWRPVRLLVSGPVGLDQPWCRTVSIADAVATVRAGVLLTNLTDVQTQVTLQGRIISPDGDEVAAFNRPALLPPNASREVFVDIDIPEPRLWWPNGYGAQPLYRLRMRLLDQEGEASDAAATRFGIRIIEMLPNDDKRLGQYNWTFAVNGRRIFAQGANWVPVDSLFRTERWRYERLIRLARDAGMTMFRVWGGGIVETPEFYDLCDEYGILVWQDFWLANDEYSNLSVAEARGNARDAVRLIRGHPSLALWCGGNEFYPDAVGTEELVDMLAEVVAEECPGIAFHRASPYRGDDHNWGVWHGLQPHTAYLHFTPFRSEAGMQAPPVVESLKRFLPESDLYPPGYGWTYHKGVPSKMDPYAQEWGAAPTLNGYVNRVQLAQAAADRFNLEVCRSRRWRTSGCLLWQFNEPWPAICWSLVDYYGTPKPAYYYFKRSASPIALVAEYDKYVLQPGEQLQVRLRLDNLSANALGNVRIVARLADGRRELKRFERTVATRADGVSDSLVVRWDVPEEPPCSALLLLAQAFTLDGKLIAHNAYEFAIEFTRKFDHGARVLMLSDSKSESQELAAQLGRWGIDVDLVTPGFNGITLSPGRGEDIAALYDAIWIEAAPDMGEAIGARQMDVIADAVSRGVGIVMDGGPGGVGTESFAGTSIERIMPVVMASNKTVDQDIVRDSIQTDHPVLRGLHVGELRSVRGANVLTPRAGAQVLIALADGSPLLVEGTHGRGRCIAYAAPLCGGADADTQWPDIHAFCARLIAYAAKLPDDQIQQIISAAAGLDGLPPASLAVKPPAGKVAATVGRETDIPITIINTGDTIAHFVRLRLDGLPEGVVAFFEDNYFILEAGRKKTVVVALDARRAKPIETEAKATVTAWNLGADVSAPFHLQIAAK